MTELVLTAKTYSHGRDTPTFTPDFSTTSTSYVDVTNSVGTTNFAEQEHQIAFKVDCKVTGGSSSMIRMKGVTFTGNAFAITNTTRANLAGTPTIPMTQNETMKLQCLADSGFTITLYANSLHYYKAKQSNLTDIFQKMQVTGVAIKSVGASCAVHGIANTNTDTEFTELDIDAIVMNQFIFSQNDGNSLFDWKGQSLSVI